MDMYLSTNESLFFVPQAAENLHTSEKHLHSYTDV